MFTAHVTLLRISEHDLLYKPGKFFLGYAKLVAGDTEKAQELFADLIEPYDKQANLLFDKAIADGSVPAYKQTHLVRFLNLESKFDTLREWWAKPDWDRCEELLRDLRDYTRAPLFRDALNLDRSPDTCFYLAEILFESKRPVEARLYVEVALGLCSTHAGALALRDSLDR